MTNPEWEKIDGSSEQIDEMWNAPHGYILRFKDNRVDARIRKAKDSYAGFFLFADHCKSVDHVSHYLICQPHPLAAMICPQARTGQPVWIRVPVTDQGWTDLCLSFKYIKEDNGFWYYVTTTPDWNIPGAEYSFKAFEEEV